MSALRVLHWPDSFWPAIGGGELQVQHLIRSQQERGWETAVVTNRAEAGMPDEDRLGSTLVRRFDATQALLAGNLPWVRRMADAMAEFKRHFRPDVIHLHIFGPFSWLHHLTAQAHPAFTLATVHASSEYLLPGPTTQMISRVLLGTDLIIGVSETQLASFRAKYPAIAPKSGVIYNGLPPPRVAASPLRSDDRTIVCLGRMVTMKGFDVALDAFARIAPLWPTARLIFGGDGPIKVELESQAAALGLSDRVEFRGWVPSDRVGHLINEASMIVVPSRYEEPFGLVAVEAAQLGRPVIATRTGGLAEVVVHGETGLLVPPNDSTALADAIGSLLARPEDGRSLGAAGQARALEHFSIARCAEAYEKLYLLHAHRQRSHSPL